MSDCSMGFSTDDKKWLDKLVVDMYEGKGADNPSVTARLQMLEKEGEVVSSVKIALFGDEKTEGLIVKFERAIGLVRGSLWAFGIMSILGMALFGWALGQIVPAAKLVIDDYYQHHPTAHQSLNNDEYRQAKQQPPQSADDPLLKQPVSK
jgi:hypothetical protein